MAAKTTQDQTTTLEGVANKTWKTTVRRAKFIARLAEAERASEEQIKDVAQKNSLRRAIESRFTRNDKPTGRRHSFLTI